MLTPKFEGNDAILTVITDENGKVNMDIRCPVGCGKCCGYWEGVKALKAWVGIRKSKCPYLHSYGCTLARRKRPIECKAYICELAILSMHELVTDKEVEKAIKEKAQDIAFTFFNRYPEIKKAKPSDVFLDENDKKLLEKTQKMMQKAP